MSTNGGSHNIVVRTENMARSDQFQPEIRRARYQRLTIYEVDEWELELLENGAPDSPLMTIAIGLLTFAATLTFTLFTAVFASDVVKTVVISATVVGWVAGGILIIIWRRTRCRVAKCVQIIRGRLLPDWLEDDQPSEQAIEGETSEQAS